MQGDRRCPKCGLLIRWDEAECPNCKAERQGATYRAETVVILSLVGLVFLSMVTGFATNRYHARQRDLGRRWFARGETELNSGHPENGIVDFRTALLYSRENDEYELSLAKALLDANHVDEARAHLTSLWERQPESGPVNLELGRLAIRERDVTQALRYFHNAIYGDWEGQDASKARMDTRLELYHFLVDRGAGNQAQAELMALTAELPPDPQLHVQVGQLFLGAKDYKQAHERFMEALRWDSKLEPALAGAGEADFELGDYKAARDHLQRALREDPHDTHAGQILEMADLVVGIDPYQPGLSGSERSRRVVRAFDQALARVQECVEKQGEPQGASPPQTPLVALDQRAMKMKPQIREQVLDRNADLATNALAWVSEAERLADASCGAPTELDQAIELAEREHGGNQK
jgi:tetratricopeptide (TPR) repeat protein